MEPQTIRCKVEDEKDIGVALQLCTVRIGTPYYCTKTTFSHTPPVDYLWLSKVVTIAELGDLRTICGQPLSGRPSCGCVGWQNNW
jgi:hypothetical protein